MALPTTDTPIYDVNDAAVWPMTSDIDNSEPVYGTQRDVPGIAEVSVEPNMQTAELKGDARVLAKKGRTDRINGSATYSKLSARVLDVILGATTAESGTTPNQVARTILASPATLPYFMFAFQILDVDPALGALNVYLPKCQLTGGTLIATSSDNFGQPTMQFEAIAIEGELDGTDGVMAMWELLETEAALGNPFSGS